MKKLLALILALGMIFCLVACGSSSDSDSGETSDSSAEASVEEEASDDASAEESAAEEASETSASSGDNTVVVAMSQGPATLDPSRVYSKYGFPVAHACYETLFYFPENDTPEPQPLLATDYSYSDDGLTLTVNLRDDVVFSSGNPMTSEDVVFSIMRTKNLMDSTAFLANSIDSVEADGDYTVIFHLNQVDSAMVSKLSNVSMSVMDSAVVREHGGTDAEDAATADTAEDWLNSNSAGSGEYVLSSFIMDEQVVLERNTNYWGELSGNVDKYILQVSADSNTQMMSLASGDIDIALNLTDDTIEELEGRDNVAILSDTTKMVVYVMMNMDESVGGAVADPLVQQAIRYAIDYEGIQLLMGDGTVTPYSLIQVGFLGNLGERPTSYTDQDKARELLAEAGYADGVTVTMTVSDRDANGVLLTDLAQKIASDLAEVGITVEIETMAYSGGYSEMHANGEMGFTVTYWGIDYNDPNNMLEFLPGQSMGLRANWTEDMAPELAELYEACVAATDTDERVAILEEIQEATYEDGPFIMIGQAPSHYGYNTRLSGVEVRDGFTIDLLKICVN